MMECDSMHSAIEREKKYVAVHTLHDWKNIFVKARSKRGIKKKDPYIVHELQYSDFINWKLLAKNMLKNTKLSKSGEKVRWLQIKCFRVEREYPGTIKYRYEHYGPYFELSIYGRGRPPTEASLSLQQAYLGMRLISLAKFNDLQKLCTTDVIPSEFHAWYSSLPTSKSVIDRNSEPSIYSNSESEGSEDEQRI
ncbi:uncharacterized protein LOC126887932 [Diabrotica virgifera virgifera]|uniref:Uncharacterized protein n=1 Tax=Diabrotica virgifera virgifera TaxID=50390 RepID=A0ABM5KNQ5_DIAVI|nr:uncharacterized protein LOC126887932 [Diabrotica virgifera virgifera]